MENIVRYCELWETCPQPVLFQVNIIILMTSRRDYQKMNWSPQLNNSRKATCVCVCVCVFLFVYIGTYAHFPFYLSFLPNILKGWANLAFHFFHSLHQVPCTPLRLLFSTFISLTFFYGRAQLSHFF